MDKITTNIVIEREQYQAIKKRLIDKRISFSQWVRDRITEELKDSQQRLA